MTILAPEHITDLSGIDGRDYCHLWRHGQPDRTLCGIPTAEARPGPDHPRGDYLQGRMPRICSCGHPICPTCWARGN
jgi:hypothetical protein